MREYSVLMSVYYKENPQFLSESIKSMLSQTKPPDDFVIVCDGPLTPELDKVIEGYSGSAPELFQIVRLEKNSGLGAALNAGMRQCRFDIVARMDSDDIAFPQRCERQLEEMERHGVKLISACVEEFETDPNKPYTRRILPQSYEQIMSFARRRNPMNHPCVMFSKAAVERAGGYKPFHLFEDYYLWVRMLAQGSRACNVGEPLLHMRAGVEMYDRRAGFTYVKSMWRFRWYMKKTGFSRWSDFLICALGQTVVCLMPKGMRMRFYQTRLRKKV